MVKGRVVTALVILLALSGCGGEAWEDHRGDSLAREDLAGRWTVVNYWAEWCAPCREELPELNALAEERPDLLVVGVNFDGLQGDTLASLSDEMGIDFPVMPHAFADALALPLPEVLPTTYVLDAQGELAHTLRGPQTKADLLAVIGQEER